MKIAKYKLIFGFIFFITSIDLYSQAIIIDHNSCELSKIPEYLLVKAKTDLRIAYNHSGYGNQILKGLSILKDKNPFYTFGTNSGSLYFLDNGITGANDLGNPDRTTWHTATRNFLLDNSKKINVVIWSWESQVNTIEKNIDLYLNLMDSLEREFPFIKFIYMTGHLVSPTAGGCEEGQNNLRNEQIRNFCKEFNKILFDFADIESYNPDGEYFLDNCADGSCNYYDLEQQKIGNWAEEWCIANPGECEDCACDNSHCLNCMMKGKAFWWLMARLEGWDGIPGSLLSVPEIIDPQSGNLKDSNNLQLVWTTVNNAISYDIQVSEQQIFNNTVIDTTVTDTNLSGVNLQGGKKYFWRVRAKSEIAAGNWSQAYTFSIRLNTPVLNFPENYEQIDGVEISLEWNEVLNAGEYEIFIYYDSVQINLFKYAKLKFPRIVPDSLQRGKTYYWKVRAINALNDSYWSELRQFSCIFPDTPDLIFQPDTLNFGDVEIGNQGELNFNIINKAETLITVNNIELLGVASPAFNLSEINFPYDIIPNDTLKSILTFIPKSITDYVINLKVSSTSKHNPNFIPIMGNGIKSTDVNTIYNNNFKITCVPNPTSGILNIRLEIISPFINTVKLKLSDLNGNEIISLYEGMFSIGEYNLSFNFSEFSSGKYFVSIYFGKEIYSLPILIVK